MVSPFLFSFSVERKKGEKARRDGRRCTEKATQQSIG